MTGEQIEMQQFLRVYQALNIDTIDTIEQIYSHDVHFIDPAHEIRGLADLTVYFKNLYQNINHISFDFRHPHRDQEEGYVQWQMTFSHPRLKSGGDILVDGASFLRFSAENKVFFHRDYFDLGSMLYQHLPLLGGVIKTINRRLGS